MNQLWLWCCNILPIPRPRHADAALAAIALAIEKQQAVGDTLIALGNSDPSLSTWARRLAPRFQAGENIEDILIGHRLIRLDECRYIRGETPQHISAGLRALSARHSTNGSPRLLLLRWFPSIFAFALVMACGGLQTICELFGFNLGAVFTELAIRPPPLTALAFNPNSFERLSVLSATMLFIISLQIVGQRIGALRVISLIVHWRIFRLWFTLKLLRWGAAEEHVSLSDNDNQPPWYWDFYCWWLGSRHLLSDEQQSKAAQHQTLPELLVATGLVSRNEHGLQWQQAIEQTEAALRSTYAPLASIIRVTLLITVVFGFVYVYFLPLIEIINKLG